MILQQLARDAAIQALHSNLSINGQADAVVRVVLVELANEAELHFKYDGDQETTCAVPLGYIQALIGQFDLLALQETPQLQDSKEDTRSDQPQLRAGESDPRVDPTKPSSIQENT